jgi:iron(III) transport system substrate-binding protein
MMKHYRKLVVLLAALLVLVACQSAENNTTTTNEPTNQLVVYSGRSENLVGPIIERFEADSGVDVDVRYGSTAEIAALLLEEGDRSPADIFFAQDPGGLGAIQAEGMLAQLPDDILAQVPDRFASPNNDWVGISGRARVVAYNTDSITDPDTQLPDDIMDFTNPEWAGRIGWPPTNGSFQAMVTAMRQTWGDDQTREWLTGIQANNPIAYEKNTPAVAGTAAGEVDVAFVNHYYLYRFLAEEGENFAARNYFLPGGGPGSLIMVAGAGILNSAENRISAEQFINYLLTTESQQFFADETFEYPVVEGVAINPLLPPLDSIDNQAIDIDLADLSDLQGTVEMLSELGILP